MTTASLTLLLVTLSVAVVVTCHCDVTCHYDVTTASLTLLLVTLSVAVVVTRILIRRRRQRARHKSHDYGT